MVKDHQLKICLLGATFDTGNMGVSALTAGLIKLIIRQFPQAEIALLDYGKQKKDYHLFIEQSNVTISLINMRFSKNIFSKNNIAHLIITALFLRVLPFQKMKSKMIGRNQCLRAIREADLIGSISGGDSFSDIYGLARFFYVSLPQLLVLTMKRNLILLPQTLGPFNRKLTRVIAGFLLNRAHMIYARDYIGLTEMNSFIKTNHRNSKLRFCYDVGFVIDPIKPDHMNYGAAFERRKRESIVVGLNISGLLYMGGYSRDNMFQFKLDYRELVFRIIERFGKQENIIVLLIPHVFGTRQNSENDSSICAQVYAELKQEYEEKLFCVQGLYDQNEIKYVIGQCDFFIGSRMHACIAAFSQYIPTVAIAYSKKFIGVMQTIDMESWIADPQNMNIEQIMDLIDQAYHQREITREILQRKIPVIRQTLFSEFKRIILSSVEP